MMGKILRTVFPDAFHAGKGWGMASIWAALFIGGLLAVESCFGPPSGHLLSWSQRLFIGTLICYASAAGFINKLIANDIL